MTSEIVEVRGHLIDSGVLSRVLDDILEYGGDYTIDRFEVGKSPHDESYARLTVKSDSDDDLARLVMRLQTHGVNPTDPGEAVLWVVENDGVFPDDFYSTTNLETVVRLGTGWVPVEGSGLLSLRHPSWGFPGYERLDTRRPRGALQAGLSGGAGRQRDPQAPGSDRRAADGGVVGGGVGGGRGAGGLDGGGAGPDAVCEEGRGGWGADGESVLQQADAGGDV